MRQVFENIPWIHKPEPPELLAIFEKYGTRRKLPSGHIFTHGGTAGKVNLLTKGLAFFSFVDKENRNRIFSILPPGRVIGDLDAVTAFHLNLIAYTARASEVLTVPNELYRETVTASAELLKSYTVNAIRKEECHMEGMIAVYSLPLEQRLIALMSSVIRSYYPLKENDWNPVPLRLTTFEIADVTVSNRSSVSTVINQWIEQGLARKDGRILLLHGALFSSEHDWMKFIRKTD